MEKNNSIMNSSMYLSLANLISVLAVMAQGMILVRALSKTDFGTYAQTTLILSVTNTLIGLGLAASLNYFIPLSANKIKQKVYANNIFGMLLITGIIGFVIIIISGKFIVDYFSNVHLENLLVLISLRPLFFGLVQGYINLFIANKLTNVVALRNIILSFVSLLLLGTVAFLTHDIQKVILCLLIIDILQFFIFLIYANKKIGKVSFLKIEVNTSKEVLTYSLPLALSAMVGTLIILMDRLIIGHLLSLEKFAVYSVVSVPLPFTIIATSIVTVIRPYITKSFVQNDYEGVKRIWSTSIELASIITWIFGFGIILVAPEIIILLYTEQYIEGVTVFNIYVIYSMIGITYYGILLSSSGRSKYILYYSLAALCLNLILSLFFYTLIGFAGPALASVISIIFINYLQLIQSKRLLKGKFIEIFNYKKMGKNLIFMITLFFFVFCTKNYLKNQVDINEILTIIIFAGFYIVVTLLFFKNKLKELIKIIDK